MTEATASHAPVRTTGFRRWGRFALLFALAVRAPAAAQDALPADAATTHEFLLAFVDRLSPRAPHGAIHRVVVWDATEKYLPGIADRPVRQGGIRLGGGAVIRLAWDDDQPRLWIDFDRDQDLTDESPIVLRHEDQGLAALGVEVRGPAGERWIVDLELGGETGHLLASTVTVLSGWEGEVVLGERRYVLSVADDLDGMFTPGADHLVVRVADGTPLVPDPMTLPRRLHLGGALYDFSLRLEEGEEGGAVVASFTQVDELGTTCRFTGTHVEGMSLVGIDGRTDSVVALLDELPCIARLPAGKYAYTVRLDGGKNLGALVSRGTRTIVGGQENVVALGPPLDNQVTVERVTARTVRLRHRLQGGEGEAYVVRTLTDNPRFTATSGGHLVGEGTFRYG